MNRSHNNLTPPFPLTCLKLAQSQPQIACGKHGRCFLRWWGRGGAERRSLLCFYSRSTCFILLIICCNGDYIALRLSGRISLSRLHACPWDISAGLGVGSQHALTETLGRRDSESMIPSRRACLVPTSISFTPRCLEVQGTSFPKHRIPINNLLAVCQGNPFAALITRNKVSWYRPTRKHPHYQSPSSTVRLLAPPSFHFLGTIDPNKVGLRRFVDGRQSYTSVQSRYVPCYASSPNDSWLIRRDIGQIEVLPDDVLLEIFDFFVVGYQDFPDLEVNLPLKFILLKFPNVR